MWWSFENGRLRSCWSAWAASVEDVHSQKVVMQGVHDVETVEPGHHERLLRHQMHRNVLQNGFRSIPLNIVKVELVVGVQGGAVQQASVIGGAAVMHKRPRLADDEEGVPGGFVA